MDQHQPALMIHSTILCNSSSLLLPSSSNSTHLNNNTLINNQVDLPTISRCLYPSNNNNLTPMLRWWWCNKWWIKWCLPSKTLKRILNSKQCWCNKCSKWCLWCKTWWLITINNILISPSNNSNNNLSSNPKNLTHKITCSQICLKMRQPLPRNLLRPVTIPSMLLVTLVPLWISKAALIWTPNQVLSVVCLARLEWLERWGETTAVSYWEELTRD